jgi:response regulator of citrate/malate metabolism
MIRVLVVDDDFMVARVHRGYVSRITGFEVVGEAHDGASALRAVDRLAPDLVLLDIYLPDMSGLDVLRALREPGRPPVDVLAITAARDIETIRAAMTGGVVHYLIKPFSFSGLRERLERYAEARRELAGVHEAGQDEVDRVYSLLRGGGRAPLPKGLSQHSCDLVVSVLRDAPDALSAHEVGTLAGMSRVSARRYLEYLCAAGVAELRPRYGGTGRPEHAYRWTGGGGQSTPERR